MSEMLYSTNRGLNKKENFLKSILKKYSYQSLNQSRIHGLYSVQFFYLECAEQSGREDGCSDPTTDNGNSKLFLKQIKNQNYDFL